MSEGAEFNRKTVEFFKEILDQKDIEYLEKTINSLRGLADWTKAVLIPEWGDFTYPEHSQMLAAESVNNNVLIALDALHIQDTAKKIELFKSDLAKIRSHYKTPTEFMIDVLNTEASLRKILFFYGTRNAGTTESSEKNSYGPSVHDQLLPDLLPKTDPDHHSHYLNNDPDQPKPPANITTNK